MGLSFKKVLGGSIGGLGGMGLLDMFGGGGNGGDLKALFDQMQRSNALNFTQAEASQLRGLDALRGSFDEAIQSVGRTGLASKMNIESAGKRAVASTGQRLTNAGLSGTTLGAQLPGAFQGQTAQALAGVDQAVAAAKGNLLTTRGAALNSALGNLSQLHQSRNAAEMRLGGMAFQHMQNQPQQNDLLGLLAGLGPLLGLLGPGGLAVGAGAQQVYGPHQ